MARTQTNTVEYFPHDSNASSGDTLTILQSRYGNDGYAFWFKLLERLSSTDGHCIDCRNPVKWQVFVAKMGVDEITTVEMLNLLVEMQAIDKDLWGSKLIWCQKLVDNFADIYKNRRRELPQKPITTDNNPITTVEIAENDVEMRQSKVKESKVNNKEINKENKKSYGEFKNVLLKDEEYKKLIDKFGESRAGELIETLSSGIKSKGYKYKDHYAAILNWNRRDEKEVQNGKTNSKSNDTGRKNSIPGNRPAGAFDGL